MTRAVRDPVAGRRRKRPAGAINELSALAQATEKITEQAWWLSR